ncbi:hypothetical protein AS031_10225 [Pseudarthrobacter enclensis]|uniref:Uncharacterized protein n=1 Tax=Pseudarthrobacter enclensis TaxID=993070 RepID=A0A0V8IQC9_9MICC|nr:hypothetical protein AS031_10225 [Pseudarthrobacter enclensis]
MAPVRARAASAAARNAATLWHRIRILRLANRSAIMPPHGPRTSDGRNCSATVMPTAVTDPDNWSTSQSWAMRCIQMAITAMKCPTAKMRKLGTLSEMKVCFQGSRSATTGTGWVPKPGSASGVVSGSFGSGGCAGTDPAESMTGWLTVADDGGGGATDCPHSGCGPGCP